MGRIGLCVCCLLQFYVAMCNILLVKKLESMLFYSMQKYGEILRGRQDTLAPWFQHCGGQRHLRPLHYDACATDHLITQ